MDTPLWYKVAQRQLGLKEFFDRYNDDLFSEKDTLPIFLLVILGDFDPYLLNTHILHHFVNGRIVTERALRYFYLYWAIAGSYANDLIVSDTPALGYMSKMRLQFPSDFNSSYVADWIAIILRSFFQLGPIIPSIREYNRNDTDQLVETLHYSERLIEERFTIMCRTIPHMYELAQVHALLMEIKQFLCGEIFPRVLYPYRKDRIFVKSVIYHYWPTILKGLDNYESFDEWEINAISEAHQKLYEIGDVNFLFCYIDMFQKLFGEDHPLSQQLNEYLKPSRENDRLRVEQYLQKLDPNERKKYLPQYLPVSDVQVELFSKEVETCGFEMAIKPYILGIKRNIETQVEAIGAKIYNTKCFHTQTSIYLYPPSEYVFFPSGKDYFVFLTGELSHLCKKKKNPYNSEDLPEYLFTNLQTPQENRSLEEIWSSILRREVNLEFLLEEE